MKSIYAADLAGDSSLTACFVKLNTWRYPPDSGPRTQLSGGFDDKT